MSSTLQDAASAYANRPLCKAAQQVKAITHLAVVWKVALSTLYGLAGTQKPQGDGQLSPSMSAMSTSSSSSLSSLCSSYLSGPHQHPCG